MPKQMVSIRSPRRTPTVADVVEQYQIAPGDIDHDFGVVQVDERDGTYTVLVETDAARKMTNENPEVSGPYSNAKIESFDLQK